MLSDLRLAWRQLAQAPGFTIVAVITLALAIGVNSAVFALVDAVLLRPVTAAPAAEIVNLFSARQGAARDFRRFSHAEFSALREARDTFAEVVATQFGSVGIGETGGVRRAAAFFISENYFAAFGVQPALGRFYTAEECQPNANIPVIVASHALWQRHGGQADFLGQILRLNGRSFTVIGVTPEGFNGPLVFSRVELWIPLGAFADLNAPGTPDLADPRTHVLNLTARLAPGITQSSLAARLPALAGRLTELQPDASAGARTLVFEPPSRMGISSQPRGGESTGPVAIAVFSMSGCVLLIACLNLANMFLARGSARAREIAIRLALGAKRSQIVRQLVVEGLALAAAGGAVGLTVGFAGARGLIDSLAAISTLQGETLALDVQLDGRVVGMTMLFCLVATLFFSVGPALSASRVDLVRHLKRQGGPMSASRLHRFFSLRHCLVMTQIALSFVLLFSAGLFLRGAIKAAQIDPGFEAAGSLVAELDYSLADVRPEDAKRLLFSAIEGASAQPGVEAAAAATFVPYSSRSEGRNARATRDAGNRDAPSASALYAGITPGYFDALGVRLLGGRDFTAAEARDAAAPPVAIIDAGLAQRLFPNGDALGQRIRLGTDDREVVGICTPHRQQNRQPKIRERVFVPYAAAHDGRAFLVTRYSSRDAAAVEAAAGGLGAALRQLDPGVPLLQIIPLTELVARDGWVWLARVGAMLFGLFGGIALLLAVVGVYGVKAYAVARRTREIGIRMAVGAQRRDVIMLLLQQGAGQIALALGVGSLLALGAGKIVGRMLYQVSPTDSFAFAASALVLSAAALLACYLPARRATRVDPVVALRAE